MQDANPRSSSCNLSQKALLGGAGQQTVTPLPTCVKDGYRSWDRERNPRSATSFKKKGDFLSVLRRKIPRLNTYEYLLDSFIQLEGLGLDDQAGPFLI